MSVFGDFQRVWLQRFPNSALPAAWEEDVRANLAKHKQKVAVLKEELEKEEFYVEYLERLLSDVEQHKRTSQDSTKPSSNSENISVTDDNTDKIAVGDNLSKVNIVKCKYDEIQFVNVFVNYSCFKHCIEFFPCVIHFQ